MVVPLVRSRVMNRKGRLLQIVEFGAVYSLYLVVLVLPMVMLRPLVAAAGNLAYVLLVARRRVAIENIRRALGVDQGTARRIARQSFGAFLLTSVPEVVKLRRHLTAEDAHEWLRRRDPGAEALFSKAKVLHEETGGCIFVTPHFGNWELLPYLAATVGIPLAITIRPLDNVYLERLLERHRNATGHEFINRRNAIMRLDRALANGRSVALLPDQHVIKGVPVDFFGRPAATSPFPALLAIHHQRPIVVVACYRTGSLRFRGYVGDPIWPQPASSEKAEVERLTQVVNRAMEDVIREHPEQYVWMHRRWKL
jgi:KDO2-lipid IV(A) lauroyltransferase